MSIRPPRRLLSQYVASLNHRPSLPIRRVAFQSATQALPKRRDFTCSQCPRDQTSSSTTDHARLNATSTTNATLPSETATRRGAINSSLQRSMDRLLTQLATASQQLNVYTGTDYTGISSLREAIIAQERQVRACHNAVTEARDAHTAALHGQSASQKEVVQLLERKHSWSATDLERYMSLIRSEHVNEQDVAGARDKLREQESQLEQARQKLEKLERKQYHEEQIWSDTIRRNSTWVTFGLMGFNILLLLANLVIIEPWRRKRMVKEINTAMSNKVDLVSTSNSSLAPSVSSAASALPEDEKIHQVEAEPFEAVSAGIDTASEELPILVGSLPQSYLTHIQQKASQWSLQVFSDELVSLRRVDITMGLVQSAAVGTALGSALTWAILRLLVQRP